MTYNSVNKTLWLNGLVVSALGIRTWWPGRATITLGKLFTHIASPVSHLQETEVQKGYGN